MPQSPVTIILTHNHRRWLEDKDGNFKLPMIVTNSFFKIALTFHEFIPWAFVRSAGTTKLTLKLLQISLLYNCFIALVHCNITHNTERKTGLICWTIRILYNINTVPYNLFRTCSDFTLSFAHTDTLNTRSLVTASLSSSTAKCKRPETITPVLFAGLFTPLECDYFHSERLSCQLRTGRRLQLPACRCLTAEVKWEEVTQCSV